MGAWGTCDFHEIQKLQKQIEALELGKDVFCRDCANELAARLLAMIKQRTPVGHKPKMEGPKTVKVTGASGKTRSFLSPQAAAWYGYVGGTLRRNWTVGEIQRTGDVYEIEIINPTDYAEYVEYGHRQEPGRYVPAIGKTLKRAWVSGTFMMTISVEKVQSMAPGLLEKMLYKYLKEVLE